MKKYKLIFILAAIFISLSVTGYFVHYLIFRNTENIFLNLIGSLAYTPLEVFIVSIVIDRLLTAREKKSLLQKMNMVEGAFFSEVGKTLLADLLTQFDNREEISRNLNVTRQWQAADFKRSGDFAYRLKIDINPLNLRLDELKGFLTKNKTFVLSLLENPNILEDERFTDLLWAITHLTEELEARDDLKNLPASDLKHLAFDIQRMYDHLASEWLDYAEHLKRHYPYLFSLVLRTHPFQAHPSAIVNEESPVV